MTYDEAQGEGFTRKGVKLIVEEQEERLVITYAQLEASEVYYLVIELVDRLSKMSGQDYNKTLEDLMEDVDE